MEEGFDLKIVTPYGSEFDGTVKRLVVRTAEGEIGILRNHINYVGTIAYGMVKLLMPEGGERVAACCDGFVSMTDGNARVVATTFEFVDQIDRDRAERALAVANERLAKAETEEDTTLARAKLARAQNRLHIYDTYTKQR